MCRSTFGRHMCRALSERMHRSILSINLPFFRSKTAWAPSKVLRRERLHHERQAKEEQAKEQARAAPGAGRGGTAEAAEGGAEEEGEVEEEEVEFMGLKLAAGGQELRPRASSSSVVLAAVAAAQAAFAAQGGAAVAPAAAPAAGLAVDLSRFRVAHLRERCRELSLPVSGKKAELVERIAAAKPRFRQRREAASVFSGSEVWWPRNTSMELPQVLRALPKGVSDLISSYSASSSPPPPRRLSTPG